MYWCKRNVVLALGVLSMAACKPDVSTNAAPKYFNLKKYFTDEATRMDKLHSGVLKTVIYNGKPEQKQVTITDWKRELGLFIESDINKPAWKDSYRVENKSDSVVYTAVDTSLRTRRISVLSKGGKVVSIAISNFTKNMLYQTKEVLTYYPDSLYLIEKHQSVKLLSTNNYQISGKLK